MHTHYSLLVCLALTIACGKNTDTSVSETAATTGATTSGDPATSDATASSDLTGAVTGGITSGVSEGQSSGPGDPGTTTGDPSLGTTSLTTEEPGTTGLTTSGDTTGETIEDCEDLEAAFASEAAEIRACVAADECGQELKGTSCGCTRNWVARLDANTDPFYALISKAEELECQLFLNGTCDCPEADGFLCTDGICVWNYL